MISSGFTQDQLYNVLDCCKTLELRNVLLPQLDFLRARTYKLSLCLQAPILDLTLRGVRINMVALGTEKEKLQEQMIHVEGQLNFIVKELTGRLYNPASWQQLRKFLLDNLGVEPVWGKNSKGERAITTDRASLELMAERDAAIRPFIELQLLWRDMAELLKVLKKGIDPDGRIRTTYSIGGTNTGRLSSSENAFGRGGNIQNITEDQRHLFISDPGYYMFDIDLSQADSWNVAMEVFRATGDLKFYEALLSGDLHTYVARLVFPDLPWTGDMKKDKDIASRPYYHGKSYRFWCKQGGHALNYLVKKRKLARTLKVVQSAADDFHDRYFTMFPSIPAWHQARITELQLNSCLTSLLDRKRYFHARLREEDTWSKAIGFLGQSPTADIINIITLRIHQIKEAELLLQTHDSLTGQIRHELIDSIMPKLLEAFRVPINITSLASGEVKEFIIPSEAMLGWNWGKRWKEDAEGNTFEANPDGLDKWSGEVDNRKRKVDPSTSLLDRCLS